MSRPLKKDGTEDMRYNDSFDGSDLWMIVFWAIIIFLGWVAWKALSGIWNWIF